MRVKKGMTGKEMRPMFKKGMAVASRSEVLDDRLDRKRGIKEGSKQDLIQDAKLGIKDKKNKNKSKSKNKKKKSR